MISLQVADRAVLSPTMDPTLTYAKTLIVTLLGGLAIATPTALAAAQAGLAPHRAVYDMTLDKTGSGAGISALTGRMVFQIKGNACEGYEQSMRFVTETLDGRGKTSVTDQRSTFFEYADKRRFRFRTDQYRNDRLSERTEGEATRDEALAQLLSLIHI